MGNDVRCAGRDGLCSLCHLPEQGGGRSARLCCRGGRGRVRSPLRGWYPAVAGAASLCVGSEALVRRDPPGSPVRLVGVSHRKRGVVRTAPERRLPNEGSNEGGTNEGKVDEVEVDQIKLTRCRDLLRSCNQYNPSPASQPLEGQLSLSLCFPAPSLVWEPRSRLPLGRVWGRHNDVGLIQICILVCPLPY